MAEYGLSSRLKFCIQQSDEQGTDVLHLILLYLTVSFLDAASHNQSLVLQLRHLMDEEALLDTEISYRSAG
jgi:hypothetical protein